MNDERLVAINFEQQIFSKISEISESVGRAIRYCKEDGKVEGCETASHVDFLNHIHLLLGNYNNDLASSIEKKKSELIVRNSEGLPVMDIHEEVDKDGNIISASVAPQRISSVIDYADVFRSLPGFKNIENGGNRDTSSRIEELSEEEINDSTKNINYKAPEMGSLPSNTEFTSTPTLGVSEFPSKHGDHSDSKTYESPISNSQAASLSDSDMVQQIKNGSKTSLFKKGFLFKKNNAMQNRTTSNIKSNASAIEKNKETILNALNNSTLNENGHQDTQNEVLRDIVLEHPTAKAQDTGESNKDNNTSTSKHKKRPKRLSKFKQAKLETKKSGNKDHATSSEKLSLGNESIHSINETRSSSIEEPDNADNKIVEEEPMLLPVPTTAQGQNVLEAVQYDGLDSLEDMEALIQEMEEEGELDDNSESEEDEHGMTIGFSKELKAPPDPQYFTEKTGATTYVNGNDESLNVSDFPQIVEQEELSSKNPRKVHFSDTLEIKHVSRSGKANIEVIPAPTEEYDNLFGPDDFQSRISAFRKARSKLRAKENEEGNHSNATCTIKNDDLSNTLNNRAANTKLNPKEEDKSTVESELKAPPKEKSSETSKEYLNEPSVVKDFVVERTPSDKISESKEAFDAKVEEISDQRAISQRYYELRKKMIDNTGEYIKDEEEQAVIPLDENGNEKPKMSRFMTARLRGRVPIYEH
ncbi:unconventional prefoldin chaperone involved protein complex assembly Uri1 [Schizosaccharomyces pombe]|uniref:Uncharacterized protein C736.07c n=1 Tax=Schizosaccharomyces pombe (strain 972 / ATCC 24843) TaxID=284812 RepID=YJC7_SCHPO|nr:putative prefoldin-like protein [Schizosaccharomyces pombe]O74953.1 RecName: Full=Uncharacterized protein C736.07c [Schizosaccharomyces pombe 972h-]CAA19271.1 unconventional prefoldin involved in translation initiation (predicted) [Schizosaccharomyces pombe]|eukprot:NP_587778.1 putative prefoldin-like protein [Schizosaccharomyces pombe]